VATSLLDEAFNLAGLDYEDLIERIDLISSVFSDPDALKAAVGEGEQEIPSGGPYSAQAGIAAIETALREMGLSLG
jgi:hypothetical protein